MGRSKEMYQQMVQEDGSVKTSVNAYVLTDWKFGDMLMLPQIISSLQTRAILVELKQLRELAKLPCPEDFQYEIDKRISQYEFHLKLSDQIINGFSIINEQDHEHDDPGQPDAHPL